MIYNMHINPNSILLTTFTHNASENMRTKVASLIGQTPEYIGTFHSLAQKVIGSVADILHIDEVPFRLYDFLFTNEGTTWAQNIKFVFVDEYQDVNEIQYKIVKRFHELGSRITIVGDDAQNIYAWRGSSVDYILRFEEFFAPLCDFQLSTNYRSSQAIIDCANDVMRFIPTLSHKEPMRCGKQTKSIKPILKHFSRFKGEKDWVCGLVRRLIAEGIHPYEIAILCKYNTLLYQIEEQLAKSKISTRLLSKRGECSVEENDHVVLSTYHAAKGLEWQHVILMGMNDDYFPQTKERTQILQERRLFYVGVTRSKECLYLTYSGEIRKLSRFVRDIQRHHITHNNITTYTHSTMSSKHSKQSVSDMIRSLDGQNYIELRNAAILPIPHFKLHNYLLPGERFTYPQWVIDLDIQQQFSNFIECLIMRMIGELIPSSGGLTNATAHRSIYSIRVGKQDWETYSKYEYIFDVLLAYGYAEEPEFEDICSAIDENWPDLEISHAERVHIVEIIFKIGGILNKLDGQRIEDFTFCSDTYCVPSDMRMKLIQAEQTYSNRGLGWRDILYEIWLISCCKSVAAGRNAIFYKGITKEHIYECMMFYKTLEQIVIDLVGFSRFKGSFLCNPTYYNEHMRGHSSMLAGLGTTLININMTTGTSLKMDSILELLCNAHIAKNMGYNVKSIVVFNPFQGHWYEMSLEDWKTGWELQEYLLIRSPSAH